MRLAHRGAASRDSIKQNRFYPKSRLEGLDFALYRTSQARARRSGTSLKPRKASNA